ncbi:hypothetical protein [Agrobacterium tumefaciens]|uniref:hypothetical protein n=1 Tax=Agrobacterium tumefaciens TaxID=358 RepID=UPI001FA9DDDB|nr:hypothetical protein [Agrobacterium tumefaciens]UNZ53878.1 hypothetical protein MLE07_24430 [Agrobacterium tumefaciens]
MTTDTLEKSFPAFTSKTVSPSSWRNYIALKSGAVQKTMKTRLPVDLREHMRGQAKRLPLSQRETMLNLLILMGDFIGMIGRLAAAGLTYCDFGFHIQRMTVYHSVEHPAPDGSPRRKLPLRH